MRFRNWLLMGTSVTLLALAPTVAARAQDLKNPAVIAAYHAYVADKSDANKQKLAEACITAGFKSFDDCVTQLAAALSAPAPASSAAPPSSKEASPPPSSKEAAPSSAPAPAPAPPAKPAPAPAAPAPKPAASSAAPPPPPAKPVPAPAPAAPDISAELANAVALYNKGAADIGAGNAKRGKQEIAKASGEIEALCQQGGFADVQSCLAKLKLTLEAIPEAPPPPAPSSQVPPPAPSSAAPAPAPAPAPAAPAPAPAAPDIAGEITKAVALYNKGAADIGAGNAKRGKQEIAQASGEIEALCQQGGFANVQSCLAKFKLTLDPIPQTPAPAPAPVAPSSEAPPPSSQAPIPASSEPPKPAPASSAEPVAPSPKRAVPSPQQPAPAASSQQPAPAASSQQPVPAPAPNGGLKKLTAEVELYNQGVAELQAGDKTGQAKIDQAKAAIDKICADGGFADAASCLAQFGLVLNPLPAKPGEPSSPASTAPSNQPPPAPSSSETPISKLPNASEAVTPSAVEVLPPQVKITKAAPILDSVKDQQTQANQGQPPSSSQAPPPAAPPAPPPTNDKQAQADIPKPAPEQQSTLTDKGKKSTVQDIQVAPPPSTDQVQVKLIQAPPAPTPPAPPPTNATPATPSPTPPPAPPQNTGVIVQIGVNIIINNPDQERSRYYDPQEDQIYYEDLSRGRVRETVTRPNGVKIVTIRNRHGDILQRSKVLPDGREILLSTFDPNDSDLDNWRDPGDDLPPLRLTIPASDYILDADTADDQEVTDFLDQPPVEMVRRIYTVDEVKRSARLRDMVRRLEVGGLTFDTGKATISRSQVGALSKVADAMQKMLDRNPGEVFLIEGHTDAVGSDISNLVLSDQRASTVARILTDFYDIPAENLVTQGYGKRFLKVKTDGPEPLNRRVTIKRITPLISYTAER